MCALVVNLSFRGRFDHHQRPFLTPSGNTWEFLKQLTRLNEPYYVVRALREEKRKEKGTKKRLLGGGEREGVCEVKEGRNKVRGKSKKTLLRMRSNPRAKGRKSLRRDERGCFKLFQLFSFFFLKLHDDMTVVGGLALGEGIYQAVKKTLTLT